jgi:hypothetical protein
MLYTFLLTAVLTGPQASPSADYWRSEYRAVMTATTERAKPQPETAVPRLIALYVELDAIDLLPRAERTRMRRSLEGRLVKQLEVLVREKRKHDRAASQRTPLAGGGATAFAAQQLIDVIVTTIAPDSWRPAGGNGSIMFYPHNPALVIRQTSEVHEQISELIRELSR